MDTETSANSLKESYLRALREDPAAGVMQGIRPEPSLDEARSELTGAISRIANKLLKDRYGPLVGAISEPAITEALKGFEANLDRAKGDITLVVEELMDRVLPGSRVKNKER
jgi:hypothetical protein